jgi:hypothetical protein
MVWPARSSATVSSCWWSVVLIGRAPMAMVGVVSRLSSAACRICWALAGSAR